MFRATALSMSFALAMMTAAAPAGAAPVGYTATPVTAPASGKAVMRDLIWNCDGTRCVAAQISSSRPAIVCAVAARELGPLSSFAAAGQPFDADALAKCNAKAR
jgi:hypothetical protein